MGGEPSGGQSGDAGELPGPDLQRRPGAGPLRDREQEGPGEEVALQRDLLEDPYQRRAREVLEPQVRVEGSGVVVEPTGAGDDGGEGDPGGVAGADRHRLIGFRERLGGAIDLDVPRAVRMAIGRAAGRAVQRSHPGPRVRGARSGVEGRVLDVVAHRGDVVVTHRLDVHERTAVGEVELTVVLVVDRVAEVHEARRRADVDLHALEDRGDVVASESERPLHPPGVDGAGAAPLRDGDLGHGVTAEGGDDLWHPGTVDEVPRQQPLLGQPGQLGSGPPGVWCGHAAGSGPSVGAWRASRASTAVFSFAPRGQPA